MKAPDWLAEFHRQWHAARGQRTATAGRAFVRDWVTLLESAGITAAADQATAAREAEALASEGYLELRRHRYRKYLIDRVSLPVAREPWLMELFGDTAGGVLQTAALEVVEMIARRQHPRFPAEWGALCAALRESIGRARTLRPFYWRQPQTLNSSLDMLWRLSAREWPVGTPVRAVSVAIGLDSKGLERRQRTVEAGLARLFCAAISLKDLGLAGSDAHVELHGPLCLHFTDGTAHDFAGLTNVLVSAADLGRCVAVTTTARRLLTIENRKTTFRQYAAANHARQTLLATTSFPSPAFRDLLAKLPAGLPHYHFGDTDPAGWHILLKLREATPRHVAPFRMGWRPGVRPNPLTAYDRQLLPKLLASPLLADVRPHIAAIATHQDRGDFEQETLGAPAGEDGVLDMP